MLSISMNKQQKHFILLQPSIRQFPARAIHCGKGHQNLCRMSLGTPVRVPPQKNPRPAISCFEIFEHEGKVLSETSTLNTPG